MIGVFKFSERPDGHEVVVEIRVTQDGKRSGHIILSSACQAAIEGDPSYPSLSDHTVEAAFCYAILLAMKFFLPLVVTGDVEAWDPRWGVLAASVAESATEH